MKHIIRVFLILLITVTFAMISLPTRPVKCCYVCGHPVDDTDTWCKTCAYSLDSIVIKNMKLFEKEFTYGLYRKPGQW